MKLTQAQTEKLKTLKTMEDVKAFLETERFELSPEDLDKIAGGWDFFSSIKKAYKDAGNWIYDNTSDPVVDGAGDLIDGVTECLIPTGTSVLAPAADNSGFAPANEK